MKKVYAEEIGGEITGLGPLSGFGSNPTVDEVVDLFSRVISIIIGFLTVIAGLWFIFQFIIGALGWLSAGGDKAKVEESQKKITNSIIGLVVVIASIFIIDLIGTLIGIDILSPGDFILNMWGVG